MPPKLCIIAGRGDLPRLIAEDRQRSGAPYMVVSFKPDRQDWMTSHPFEEHLYEKPARLFRSLRNAEVDEIVFAGATSRPRLRPWRFDHGTLKIGARVLKLLRKGDDGLLSGLASLFEAEGFRMRGAGDLLPELGVQPGYLGKHRPSDEDRADAKRGAAILRALGDLDVGQAVVVARGLCLGIETIEGTDALLVQVAGIAPELRHRAKPPSGLLLKMPKPNQDRRVDLPTIGVQTVEGAAAAGLAGIAVEAGGTNLLDREATIAAADEASLFLWAVEPAAL